MKYIIKLYYFFLYIHSSEFIKTDTTCFLETYFKIFTIFKVPYNLNINDKNDIKYMEKLYQFNFGFSYEALKFIKLDLAALMEKGTFSQILFIERLLDFINTKNPINEDVIYNRPNKLNKEIFADNEILKKHMILYKQSIKDLQKIKKNIENNFNTLIDSMNNENEFHFKTYIKYYIQQYNKKLFNIGDDFDGFLRLHNISDNINNYWNYEKDCINEESFMNKIKSLYKDDEILKLTINPYICRFNFDKYNYNFITDKFIYPHEFQYDKNIDEISNYIKTLIKNLINKICKQDFYVNSLKCIKNKLLPELSSIKEIEIKINIFNANLYREHKHNFVENNILNDYIEDSIMKSLNLLNNNFKDVKQKYNLVLAKIYDELQLKDTLPECKEMRIIFS